MIEAIGNEQAAEKEKHGHGDVAAGKGFAGYDINRIAVLAAMGKYDHYGADQPDDVEVIPAGIVEVFIKAFWVAWQCHIE